MKTEWCSRCQAVQQLNTSLSDRIEKDKEGNEKKIEIKSYQCSKCNSFICSEEVTIDQKTDNKKRSEDR